MRSKQYLACVIVVICFTTGLSPVSAQDEDLVPLLDRITERISSYQGNINIKAGCLTKMSFMNKHWQPQSTQTVKSIINFIDGEMNEEILEAVETENGKIKDVTQEYIKNGEMIEKFPENPKMLSEEMSSEGSEEDEKKREVIQKLVKEVEEQQQKDKEESVKTKIENETGNNFTDSLPFTRQNRTKYNFKRLDDSVIDGRSVYIIEAKVKEKDRALNEGKYFIDNETFDVLKFQGEPSQDPFSFIDVIDEEIQYEVLPQDIFVLKSFKVRQKAGIWGMIWARTAMEVEYSDYEILPSGNFGNSITDVQDSEKEESTSD